MIVKGVPVVWSKLLRWRIEPVLPDSGEVAQQMLENFTKLI